jgi:hypothetical protein
MFGIGLASLYGQYTLDFLGGVNAAFLYAVFVRILVGIGWWLQFRRAGKNPWLAFAPLVGPYIAFRLVWDDFSFAFIFGATTTVAFINGMLVEQTNAVISAFSVVNHIMWWLLALLSTRAYGTGMIIGLLYGAIPWLGSILLGLWPSADYKGPWSSDPENEQNLSTQERKTRRKKAAKEARRKEQLAKEQARRERKRQRDAEENDG